MSFASHARLNTTPVGHVFAFMAHWEHGRIGPKAVPLFRQMTYVRGSKPHEPPAWKDSIMSYRFVAAAFLVSTMALAQTIDVSKVGTVHVYREGRLLMGVSLFADGQNVASLSPHQMATFYLAPGHHELALQSGEVCPKALFETRAGGEYFFRADYEHVVSATSLRDLRMSLSIQPSAGDAEDLREVTIDQSKLTEILAKSNPGGLEPTDSTSTGANTTTAEQAPLRTASSSSVAK
jgi:hypothetical protein